MRCIISYHETRQFVQVVSTLIISDDSQWAFLKVVQKSQSPLDRSNLVKRCISDSSLIRFILDTVQDSENMGIKHVSLTTFFACTMVDLFQTKEEITENDLALVIPRVLSILNQNDINLQASVVMIINQLSSKCVFDDKLQSLIMGKLASRLEKRNLSFMLPAMIVLVQTQNSKICFSLEVMQCLRQTDGALEALVVFLGKFNGDRFMKLLLSSCLSNGLKNQDEEDLEFIKKVLKEFKLDSDLSEYFVDLLLGKIREFGGDFASLMFKSIYEVIPEAVNNALSRYFSSLDESEKESDAVFIFSQKALEDTLSEPLAISGTSLLLSLEHPHNHVRCMAVRKLADTLHKKSKEVFNAKEIQELLLNRLNDEEEVVRAVLKINNLVKFVTYKELMQVLVKIIWSDFKPKVLISAIKAVIKYFKFEVDSQIDLSVLQVCYCFALMSKDAVNISEALLDNLRKYQPQYLSFLQNAQLYKSKDSNLMKCNYAILKSIADHSADNLDSILAGCESENKRQRFVFGAILNQCILVLDNLNASMLNKILETVERIIYSYIGKDSTIAENMNLKKLLEGVNDFSGISDIEMRQLSVFTLKNMISKLKQAEESSDLLYFAKKIFGIISQIRNQDLASQLLIELFNNYKGSSLEICCSQIIEAAIPTDGVLLSLKVMAAYLKSLGNEQDPQLLIPFILVASYHRSNAVRLVAFEVLNILQTRYAAPPEICYRYKVNGVNLETINPLDSKKASFLVAKLMERKIEMIGDPTKITSYVSDICLDR